MGRGKETAKFEEHFKKDMHVTMVTSVCQSGDIVAKGTVRIYK